MQRKHDRSFLQVAATLHSADETVDTTAMAINAISAALMHSQIPWAGPVGAVRLAIKGDEHNLSPSMQKLAEADASMLLVGRRNEVVMIDMQVSSPICCLETPISSSRIAYYSAASFDYVRQAIEAILMLLFINFDNPCCILGHLPLQLLCGYPNDV